MTTHKNQKAPQNLFIIETLFTRKYLLFNEKTSKNQETKTTDRQNASDHTTFKINKLDLTSKVKTAQVTSIYFTCI